MLAIVELQELLLALIAGTSIGSCLGGWLMAKILSPKDSTVSRLPTLQPGQWAEVTHSLEWLYGNSITLPVGSVIQLVARSETSGGPRWSAWFRGAFVSNIPEDMIKPHDWQGTEANEGHAAGPDLPSEPCPSHSYPPLPSGVTVENQELGWQWIVRNPFTSQVLEWGTEPSEIDARKMAFAAYDRSTEDETPLASREQETTLEKFEKNSPGFKQRLLAQLRARYRPRLVDRLFQLLETPTAELTANDRRIVNDLFSSLCILNTAAGVVDNRTSGPIRSADSGSDLLPLTSHQPAG